MGGATRRLSHTATLVVAAVAIWGLLAMHAFDVALVHTVHVGSYGHVHGVDASSANGHSQHGPCAFEEPGSSLDVTISPCDPHQVLGVSVFPTSQRSQFVSFANRAVLTAFSILRV
jgi:hypothetical protein